MLRIKTKLKAGFSLVEIMTALFIVSIGLIGVMSLIVQTIQTQNLNKGALVSYQLAQEGVELIRKTRDSNWKQGKSYDSGLAPGDYIIDYTMESPRYFTIENSQLIQDSFGYYYNSDDGIPSNTETDKLTQFTRKITLSYDPDIADDKALKVHCLVTWTERNKIFNYALDTTLYDWK